MNHDFPHDETGELLRLMQEQGDDLARPRDVDFFLIFDSRDQALSFANQADLGPEFNVSTTRYEKTSKWQARLTVRMAPVYAEIVMLEKQVARLGREFAGQPDGWGCGKSTGP
ncbi:MAG: ribonuclease E inhibitor RraB [Gammaproteobacteria bacterium]